MKQQRARVDDPEAEGLLPWLEAGLFSELNGRGIAASVVDLIEDGRLPAGTKLPTVRDLANRLGTNHAAVADAWGRLRQLGLVDTRRRGGTTVLAPDVAGAGPTLLDLSQATSDPEFQPDLELAVAAGLRAPNLHSSEKEFITPALQRAVMKSWPCAPQAWTTAAGGADAALAAYAAAMTGGSIVAIEEPTSPRILEALAALGARLLPVSCDKDGPSPIALERALVDGATTFIYQPRAQLPLGHNVSAERVAELAAVIAAHDNVVVVEEDSLGPLATHPAHSMGAILPDRILHVRAYCRAYGGDLKTAVIGGGKVLIDRVNTARNHGYNVTSRILQNALAHLIESSSADRLLAAARSRYAGRRDALAQAFRDHGVATANADGLILWVPVKDENATILNLARRGIMVGAGSRCFVTPTGQNSHLRIATSRLPDEPHRIETIAATIADAIFDPVQAEYD
jgi:DNA-binding transcriptional MocR family regulator